LANIKADLRTRIGEFDKKVEVESTAACPIVESDFYAEELEQELSRTMMLYEFHGSDMVSADDGQCLQLTACRVLRSEEAARVWRNDRVVEELERNPEEGEPGLQYDRYPFLQYLTVSANACSPLIYFSSLQ